MVVARARDIVNFRLQGSFSKTNFKEEPHGLSEFHQQPSGRLPRWWPMDDPDRVRLENFDRIF